MGASVQRAGHRRRAANAVPLQPAAAVDGVAVGRRRPGVGRRAVPAGVAQSVGGAVDARRCRRRAARPDHRHAVGPAGGRVHSPAGRHGGRDCGGRAGVRRRLGQADVAGDADSGRAGAGAVLRRGQQPVGAVSLRSAAGHVPVGNRCAEPTGLERRAVHSAAFAGGRPAGGTVAAPADAAGAGRWCGAQPGAGVVDGALLHPGAGHYLQRHVGECGGRYRLYRPVCAADGEDAGRAPPGAPHDAGAVAGGAAAVVDRSGDDRGDAGVA